MVELGCVVTVDIVETVAAVDTVGTVVVVSNIWTSRNTTNLFPEGLPGTCNVLILYILNGFWFGIACCILTL